MQNNVFALEQYRGGLYLLYWFLFITSHVTLSDKCELKAFHKKENKIHCLFLSNRFHFLLNILNLNRLNQANVGSR